MHFISLILLVLCCIKNPDHTIPQNRSQCLYFTKTADPNSILNSKTIHILWHCSGHDDCYFSAMVAHINFQFFDPVSCEACRPLTFINDLPAFLSITISYGLYTVCTANAFADFSDYIKRESQSQHLFQCQFLNFTL